MTYITTVLLRQKLPKNDNIFQIEKKIIERLTEATSETFCF